MRKIKAQDFGHRRGDVDHFEVAEGIILFQRIAGDDNIAAVTALLRRVAVRCITNALRL
ncbi:hypothetical protein D3C75_1270840 [compost metagenome]